MSWFDTSGIAILAKNALKEAQKQIDKALDIKDDEEATDLDANRSSDKNTSITQLTGPRHTDRFTHLFYKTSTIPKSAAIVDSVFLSSKDGSFFDQSPHVGIVTITKSSDRLQRKCLIEAYQKDDSSSPLTESIEVITPATIPGTALTSSCQPSSNMNMIHGNRNSESVNSICNIETKSGFITIQTIITLNRIALAGAGGDKNYPVLPEHLGVNNEENCVNDDPISYTLSEQPSIVVETARCLSPITVAPSRSSHHISHAPNSSTKGNLKNYQEYSIDKLNLGVQALNDNTILDKNYEHIEIHMQTSELTHSFEEVHKNKIHTNIFGGTKAQCRENLFYFTDANSQCAIPEICNNSFQNLIDDEIETTTSSDIEIISSPNGGDSSSTHSGVFHASPHKIAEGKGENIDLLLSKKHRRHIREPSEISIISGNSDESEQLSEVDLLMRRFVEVSESLEQREYRLVELGRKNAELNEQNAQLLTLLESKGMSDVSSDPDGYMHRLSALERKFQLSIREKEQLKSDIDTLRVEAQQTIARNEVEKVLMERDAMITELRTEGEILSKQVLQHSNIIKKLRSTEKENDVLIRKQRDELIKLVEEAERLKRSLSAKEEVERSQIDAVHKLTSEKKKLECDCTTLNGYLDDQVQKYETLRKSFDFARKEFNDRSDLIQDIQKQLNVLKSVEADFEMVKAKNCHLTEQLEYVREQFHRTGLDYEQRLIKTKNEHTELLYRLEAAETRLEEEKNASVLLTIPLMKQIESIQNTMRYKEHAWEQQDSTFYQQLADMLTRVELLSEKEQIQRDNLSTMHQRIVNLESRLVNAFSKIEEMSKIIRKKKLDVELLEHKYIKRLKACEEERRTLAECLLDNERHNNHFAQKQHPQPEMLLGHDNQQQISLRKIRPDTNSQCNVERLVESSNMDLEELIIKKSSIQESLNRRRAELSPTPSIGNSSLPDSLPSIPWNIIEDETVSMDTGPIDSGIAYNLPILFNNTTQLETLQANLKQRDGEVYQLQWEVSRFQLERNFLGSEISNLTIELDSMRDRIKRSIKLEEEHIGLQNRYDALLQIYGESVEKTEELRLDLLDVKEMYKLQIDDLLRQQRDLPASTNQNEYIVTQRTRDTIE